MPPHKRKASIALDVHGLGAEIEVRRHPNARRLTLRVDRRRKAVIVTLPNRCRMDEATSFLNSNIDWVRDRLGRVPEPVPFADGVKMPLRGRAHRVCFTGPGRADGVVAIDRPPGGTLRLNVTGRPEHAARRLKDWLMAEARKDIDERVVWHASQLDVRVRRITLRDQSSRWGSCSASGLLSFSWRLILAPPHVLDYVAAHEVAHLLEMNHGPRFWKLVAQCVPRLDEARHWLRLNGVDLHRYGTMN